jgi:hypothetical protein
MNNSVFIIRQWISIGLCMLGFTVPVWVLFYEKLRYPSIMNTPSFSHWLWLQVILYQWLPITSLLWLIAGYVYPDNRLRIFSWIIFGFGILLSALWYALYRVYRQY